ncbi:hypothetical protein L2E82_30816 [Cichorium intybus]|uniref:Uncharacterized protein n=1 Tax=Cichorium intybus TaxID=13427 RepID=A0ACB9D1E0_CICIN|nr:hypothetical protein L2E82_30816 [Cichorium intybus]
MWNKEKDSGWDDEADRRWRPTTVAVCCFHLSVPPSLCRHRGSPLGRRSLYLLSKRGVSLQKPKLFSTSLLPDHRTGAAVPSLPSPPTSYLSSSIRSTPTPPVIKKKWIKSAICSGVDDIRFISF